MIVNKGLKVILSIVIAWSLLTPFNIQADETVNTTPFLGFNVQITGYGENMSSIQIPKINFSYAGNTVPSGYISGKLNCTSPSTPTSSAPCDIFSLTNNNGQYSDLVGLKVVFPLQSYLLDANGNAIINHQSYFFIDYEFILDDNYKGYVIITSSDNVAHTIYVNGNNFHYQTFTQDPSNPLTFTISEYDLTRVSTPIMWNVPMESLSIVSYAFQNELDLYSYGGVNNLQYPIFYITNKPAFQYQLLANRDYYFIFGISMYLNWSGLKAFLGNPDVSKLEYETVAERISIGNNGQGFIYKIKIHANSNQTLNFYYNQPYYYIPIYFNFVENKYITEEFATRWGINGTYINEINENDTANSQLETSSNQLFTQEDYFKSDMNNAMSNIPSFSVNNFGSKFMSSATWVRQQYERMTNNTPFQQVITFSLLVGLSMILIGKVRK